MSEIKALEKLREMSVPDRKGIEVFMKAVADEIQAEVDERFMELPLDADGVPIHLDDMLEITHGFDTKDVGEVTDIHLQSRKNGDGDMRRCDATPDGFCAWGERRERESAEVWNQWSADDVTCSEES